MQAGSGGLARAVDSARSDEEGRSVGRLEDKIALVTALGYLDFRMPDFGWRDGNSGLADWFAAMSERASVQATMPQG